MDEKLKLLVDSLGPERVKLGEKLIFHTYTKTGGEAKGFYIATSQRELVEILEMARELKIPYFILGAGTKANISEKGLDKLVVKNRTGNIKIGGIKGKVGRGGIGIEEALVEVDSGVSINKLNEYLEEQGLKTLTVVGSSFGTLGGTIFLDPNIISITQNVKVWDDGEIIDIEVLDLTKNQIVLSVVLKVKSNSS